MKSIGVMFGLVALSIPTAAFAAESFHFEDITPKVDPVLKYPTYVGMTSVHENGIYALTVTVGPTSFQFVHSDEKGFQRRTALSGEIVDFTPKGSMALNGTIYNFPTGGSLYNKGRGWTFNAITGEKKTYHVFKTQYSEYTEVRPFALDDFGNVLADCSELSNGYRLAYAQLVYLRNGEAHFLDADINNFFHNGRLIANGVAFVQSGWLWGFYTPETGWRPLARPTGAVTFWMQMDVNRNGIAVYPGRNAPSTSNLQSVYLADEWKVTSIPKLVELHPDGYSDACINNLNQIAVCCVITQGSEKRIGWVFFDGKNAYDLNARIAAQVPSGWTFDEIFDIDDAGRIYGRMKTPDGFQALVRIETNTTRTP